ncbi:MAG: hypothetical protein LJE75_03395 [Gammaproteobacteria bacterium]|jgi:hypothetical protein|nr:hypothetical protein [Gammaproteobacteria bacterium]
MVQATLRFGRIGRFLTALVIWFHPVATVQAEDDYLSILEAEAADTAVETDFVSSPVGGNQVNNRFMGTTADKVIVPGLSFEDFETELSTRYSGSHSLYVKLSEKKRREVFAHYQSDNRISSVREEIVRLLSSG